MRLTDQQTQLVLANLKLARYIARKFAGRSAAENDDLAGAAYLGLCEAAQRFDAGQGIKFGTYAFSRIWGTVLRYLKRDNRPGGLKVSDKVPPEARPSIASMDAPMPGTDDLYLGDVIPSTASVEDAAIERVALSSMPEDVLITFRLRQAGLTQKDVGQILKCSLGTVANRLALARRYLEAEVVDAVPRAASGRRK